MSRLFQPRSLVSRLRWTKPPQPAPRTEAIKVVPLVGRGPTRARRVGKLVVGGIAIYSFVKFVDIASQIQGFEGEILIPLPFTKTTFPSEPYRGSDPEWHEFVKVSRDPVLQQRIKRELAELAAKSHSTVMKLIHAVAPTAAQTPRTPDAGARPRNWLLSLDFPSWPPPEVGTLCLTIDEETIALNLQRVEPATQAMIDQIWWPWAATQALWEASAFMFKQGTSHVAQSEGPSDGSTALGSPPRSYDNRLQHDAERAGNQPTSPEWQRNKIRVKSKLPPNEAPPSPFGPGSKRAITDLIARQGTGMVDVFMMNYFLFRPWSLPPPRGCFNVSGVVTLETDKAFLTIAADGWYNPKTGLFDEPSMVLRVTRMAPKQQGPLR